MKFIKTIISFLFIIGIISSCSDDPCRLDTEPLLTLSISVEDNSLISANYTEGLYAYAPEWDDSIQYASENIDSIMLSPNHTLTTLILESTNEILKDTLYVYHQNNVRLLSMECGFVIDYEIDTIINTWNLIDSISVVKDKITNEKSGLVEIYYF